MGRAVARIGEAFGMHVLIADRPGAAPQAGRIDLAELLRTADVVTHEAPSMIGLTLTLYVALYLGLIVAYVTVLKYLAEKPDAAHDALGTGAAAPPGLDAALAATGGPA